ncbi:MAG: VacJ family lipoprotein, partial [Gammaproteobacteria bacterium]|nr:VacJ family lipoprotein [Gammaproteobacteria bacterium]
IAMSRFLINTTVGIGGLWDVASRMEITGQEEDFGQTLGVWGWEDSR